MTAARALKGPFWATPWLLQLPSGPTWQPLGLAAEVAQAHSCIAHCSPLAHDSQNHRSVAQAVGLARKPSQPSPMQRNRPPHGPPAGGGFRRLASAAVLAPTRCVWSLRVRPFGSPSPLRGAGRLLRTAGPLGPWRGAGPPRRFGGVRLPLAALAGRPPALPALSLGRARSLRSGRRRPPPSLCSVAVGPPGGLVGLPGGPGACSPGALPRRGFAPRLFLFPGPPSPRLRFALRRLPPPLFSYRR